LTRRTFAILHSDTAEKSWTKVEYRSAEFCADIVFPPANMELLPVREAKKSRRSYDEQMKKEQVVWALFRNDRRYARHTQSISNGWYRLDPLL